MRNRHEPRLCHACQAPMGGQEDTCWRCGAAWAPPSRTALRVIDGGGAVVVAPAEVTLISTAQRLAGLVAAAGA